MHPLAILSLFVGIVLLIKIQPLKKELDRIRIELRTTDFPHHEWFQIYYNGKTKTYRDNSKKPVPPEIRKSSELESSLKEKRNSLDKKINYMYLAVGLTWLYFGSSLYQLNKNG
jgi:hypothetical protein